jgi:hypothetical protein
MKKRLTLKAEQLAELTADELRQAGGAAPEQFTGRVDCILSAKDPCVTNIFCSLLCGVS